MDCIKVRDPPIVKTLGSKEFKSILNNVGVEELVDIFKKNNYELRIAGGAVR